MSEKVSEKMLSLIKENPYITTAILAKKLDKSPRTVERAIKILKEENQIERIGGDKGGYWKVTER